MDSSCHISGWSMEDTVAAEREGGAETDGAAVQVADGGTEHRAAEGAPSGGRTEHGLNGAKH